MLKENQLNDFFAVKNDKDTVILSQDKSGISYGVVIEKRFSALQIAREVKRCEDKIVMVESLNKEQLQADIDDAKEIFAEKILPVK